MADNSLQVFAPGATIATSATSAAVAIPNTLSGTAPKYVRLASTQPCYVRLGTSPVAVAGDLLVQPADSVVVCVARYPQIAALQLGAAGILQISPLENQ
jgi:hypothetical protein